MPSLSNESKNDKSLSNETTDNSLTWDKATNTWADATAPWESPGRPVTKESKNNKTLINDSEHI